MRKRDWSKAPPAAQRLLLMTVLLAEIVVCCLLTTAFLWYANTVGAKIGTTVLETVFFVSVMMVWCAALGNNLATILVSLRTLRDSGPEDMLPLARFAVPVTGLQSAFLVFIWFFGSMTTFPVVAIISGLGIVLLLFLIPKAFSEAV